MSELSESAIPETAAEAAGDNLLQAAGDIAGQAEKAGEGILQAVGDIAGEAVEKAESAGDSLLRAAGDIAGERQAHDRHGR